MAMGINIELFAPDIVESLVVAPGGIFLEAVGDAEGTAATNSGATVEEDALLALVLLFLDPAERIEEEAVVDRMLSTVGGAELFVSNARVRGIRYGQFFCQVEDGIKAQLIRLGSCDKVTDKDRWHHFHMVRSLGPEGILRRRFDVEVAVRFEVACPLPLGLGVAEPNAIGVGVRACAGGAKAPLKNIVPVNGLGLICQFDGMPIALAVVLVEGVCPDLDLQGCGGMGTGKGNGRTKELQHKERTFLEQGRLDVDKVGDRPRSLDTHG